MFRKKELKLNKRIGITQEVHEILRNEKKKQKKSIARIVNDLVINFFKNK